MGRPDPATPWASSGQAWKGIGLGIGGTGRAAAPAVLFAAFACAISGGMESRPASDGEGSTLAFSAFGSPSDPSLSPYVSRRDGGSGSRGRRPAHRRRASVVCPCKRGSFPRRPSRSRRAWSAAAGRHVGRVPFSGRDAAAALGALDDPRSPCAQNIIKWRQLQRRAVATRAHGSSGIGCN